MGMTDFEIAENYTSVVSEILNELPTNSRVAWLGQKHPNAGKDKFLYDSIMSGVNNDLNHDFYDLNNEEFEGSYKWDVHDTWSIGGYDLVLGLRVLYLCDAKSFLIDNLKNVTLNNDRVVFDFMTGNPVLINNKETFIKRNNSKTILPFFPEWYDGNYFVQSNHDDQILVSEDLNRAGLIVENVLTFRDGIKRRFYSICEFSNDA